MKFSEFIGNLYPHYACNDQGRFVLQIFSALCGESNPIELSKETTSIYSEFLPLGLRGNDPKARKNLFNKNSAGLTAPIREHIINNNNKNSFLSYSEFAIGVTEFTELCGSLTVKKPIERSTLFIAIFEQFLEFAKTQSNDVVNIIENIIERETVLQSIHEISNLPDRNENFTGRSSQFDIINEHLMQKDGVSICQTVAGLGGIGKTQLAIEYAYRYCNFFHKAIWFTVAETTATIQNHFTAFAERFSLPLLPDYKPEDLQREVRNWLSENKNWLIIFDNVESYDVVKPYLPQKINGRLIITTRNAQIDDIGEQIQLGVFDEKESLSFLQRRFSSQKLQFEYYKFDDFETQAPILALRLGYLPLALEQAAAYIKAIQCTITDYLDMLNEKSALKILNKDEEYAKPQHYKSHVTDTWRISFDYLKDSAKHLFNLCAYMAPDRIPIAFFTEMSGKLPDELSELKKSLQSKNATHHLIADLRKFSLVSGDVYYINIHRLVQEVVRESHESGEDI
jgi:hypothetical protein